jgi:hypothetical protein
LRVVLISNIEMDIPVRQVKARDISLEAAGKRERVAIAIKGAILDLKARGEKITQRVVSVLTGIPRGSIARYWGLFVLLLESLNSKVNNFNEVSDVDREGHQAISGVLDEMAGLPVDEMLPSLEEVFFRWVKREDWAIVWAGVSAGAQIGILRGLAIVLPGRVLERVG